MHPSLSHSHSLSFRPGPPAGWRPLWKSSSRSLGMFCLLSVAVLRLQGAAVTVVTPAVPGNARVRATVSHGSVADSRLSGGGRPAVECQLRVVVGLRYGPVSPGSESGPGLPVSGAAAEPHKSASAAAATVSLATFKLLRTRRNAAGLRVGPAAMQPLPG